MNISNTFKIRLKCPYCEVMQTRVVKVTEGSLRCESCSTTVRFKARSKTSSKDTDKMGDLFSQLFGIK